MQRPAAPRRGRSGSTGRRRASASPCAGVLLCAALRLRSFSAFSSASISANTSMGAGAFARKTQVS